eukprot:3238350-Rhodomonas_salina.1
MSGSDLTCGLHQAMTKKTSKVPSVSNTPQPHKTEHYPSPTCPCSLNAGLFPFVLHLSPFTLHLGHFSLCTLNNVLQTGCPRQAQERRGSGKQDQKCLRRVQTGRDSGINPLLPYRRDVCDQRHVSDVAGAVRRRVREVDDRGGGQQDPE